MAVKKILLVGNGTVLERPAAKVEDFGSKRMDCMIEDLKETLHEMRRRHGMGRGIAAPQIGNSDRVIYIIDELEQREFPLINPIITYRSKDAMKVWDSCLSYDLNFFIVVERSKSITVSFKDKKGRERRESMSGPLSELVQHATDHLEGILSVQRAIMPISMMMRAEWEAAGKPGILG